MWCIVIFLSWIRWSQCFAERRWELARKRSVVHTQLYTSMVCLQKCPEQRGCKSYMYNGWIRVICNLDFYKLSNYDRSVHGFDRNLEWSIIGFIFLDRSTNYYILRTTDLCLKTLLFRKFSQKQVHRIPVISI